MEDFSSDHLLNASNIRGHSKPSLSNVEDPTRFSEKIYLTSANMGSKSEEFVVGSTSQYCCTHSLFHSDRQHSSCS